MGSLSVNHIDADAILEPYIYFMSPVSLIEMDRMDVRVKRTEIASSSSELPPVSATS